jgi:hypothetical protein
MSDEGLIEIELPIKYTLNNLLDYIEKVKN